MIHGSKRVIPDGHRYIYDPTPGRKKHRWKKNVAGFDFYYGVSVGKCPHNIHLSEAQELLNNAIADPPDPRLTEDTPKRLYNVYCGVIYTAIRGGDPLNYHAYPTAKIDDLDESTLDILRERAYQAGYETEFKQWVKKYA